MPRATAACAVECAAAHQAYPGMHADQMVARMRTHEYPQFMRLHMQQRGMSHQEAHNMYMQYERYKVMGGCG